MTALQFPGLRNDEHVTLAVQKHWIVVAKVFGEILIGIILVNGVAFGGAKFFAGTTILGPLNLLTLILVLFIWLWGFLRLLDEELDTLIVTDQRVINITQASLFKISIRETSLDLIEDAGGSNIGILGNLLHFGRLAVETASTNGTLAIDPVPAPGELAREIMNRKDTFLNPPSPAENPQAVN